MLWQAFGRWGAMAANPGNPATLAGTGGLGSAVNAVNPLSLSYPTGVALNDILIAHIAIRSATATNPTVTTPSGWTSEGSQQMGPSSEYRQFLLWKRADGTESGSLSFSWTADGVNGTAIGRMTSWSGCATSGSPIVSLATNGGQDTSAESAAVTTSQDNQVVVNLIATDDDTSALSPPSGYTEQYDDHYSSGLAMTIGMNYKTIAGAGLVSSVTTTLSTSERWAQTSFGLKRL